MPRLIFATTHETIRTNDRQTFLATFHLVSCIAIVFSGKSKRSLTHHSNTMVSFGQELHCSAEMAIESFIKREIAWINHQDKLVRIDLVVANNDFRGRLLVKFLTPKLLSLNVKIRVINSDGTYIIDHDRYLEMLAKGISFEKQFSEAPNTIKNYSDQNLYEVILKESIEEGSSLPSLRYEDRWLKIPAVATEFLAKFNPEYFGNDGAIRFAAQAKIPEEEAKNLLEKYYTKFVAYGGERRYPKEAVSSVVLNSNAVASTKLSRNPLLYLHPFLVKPSLSYDPKEFNNKISVRPKSVAEVLSKLGYCPALSNDFKSSKGISQAHTLNVTK